MPPDRLGYTARPRDLEPGAVVGGYRIESMLGRGGMGVVYRARELDLDRVVALKVIAPELVEDEATRARFLREARAAAAIDHPNVIPVHAAGEADGLAFIAMRMVSGHDLRVLVRRAGPPALAHAAAIVEQAAAGLDAIHRGGFVHRDVKPANLLVDASGHVYVTDFGLVKQVLSHAAATSTGQWVGTLDYVSPEQIRGGRIDARADVYALGGVLYFAVTGRVPFEREGDEAKLWAQLSESPPRPSQVREGIPVELDAVVARAMRKSPDQRYPSAGDLARAARAAIAGTSPSQPERMVARGAAAPGGGETEPGLAPEASTVSAARDTRGLPPRSPRRRRWPLPVALLAALGIGAVGAAVLPADDSPTKPPGAAAKTPPTDPMASIRAARTIRNVGDRPNAIVYAGGDLWVASFGATRMTRIDATTGRERQQHPRVGRGVNSLTRDGNRVWAAVGPESRVVAFDARTGRTVRRLALGLKPLRLVAGPSGLWILVRTPWKQQQLLRYDRAGRRLRQTVDLPTEYSAMTLGAGSLWLGEKARRGVERMDAKTGRRQRVFRIAREMDSLSYSGGLVWASSADSGTVTRIDPRSGAFATFAAGHEPSQAVVAADRVFVASRTDQKVLVFDLEHAAPIGALTVPLNPYALATDGRSVWATSLAENAVTQITTG